MFLSLNQTLMTFLVLERLTWRNQLILTISLPLLSFNPKGFCYSYAWSCSLWEGRNSFCMGLISGKLYGFLFIFLNAFTSFSVLLLFHLLITFFIFMHDSDATHSVHPPPPLFFWRGGGRSWTSYQISKKGGLGRTSTLRGGYCKIRGNFLWGVAILQKK